MNAQPSPAPPADRPTLVVREYRRQSQYERDFVRLRKDGWKVVSVLERPPRRGWPDRLTSGLYSALFPPRPERLVTYSWEGRDPVPARPVPWLLPPHRRHRFDRRWWIVLVVLLLILLALSIASFFGDVGV